MRFSFPAVVVACGLLASCAFQGVIVDKSGRDLPFGESVGMGASLAFMLKDNTGAIRRQLVTPEVYARYQVGDYFNDMQPGPARQPGSSDGKTMLTAMNSRQPSSTRTAAVSKKTTARRVAKKAPKKQSAIAAAKRKPAKKVASAVKPAQPRTVAAAAQPTQSPVVTASAVKPVQPRVVATAAEPTQVAYVGVVRVARCR